MARTGRQPYDTTDVALYGAGSGRLRPPATLGEPERKAFVDLIVACPASQFTRADIPLLARWAESQVIAETAAGELAAGSMVVTDDKGKASVSPWFAIHQQATKTLSGLALRLRLGPQSRAFKAPKKTAGRVSYFERMELEGVRDDDGDDGR
jgi:phage terminase small subunit